MEFTGAYQSENKQVIASRMVRNAAKAWGYSDTELDNFDPLIKLIIEACSVEIFMIQNEIVNVQQRMLERLANLLTPEVYTATKPAHAIMHTRSLEPVSQVLKDTQFFFQKKVASKMGGGVLDSNLDIFFSPSGAFRIFDADVKMMICGNSVYGVNEAQTKEFLFRMDGSVAPHSAWIALDLNDNIEDLVGMSFYFDFKNLPNKQHYQQLLQFARWSVNDLVIEMSPGLWDAETAEMYHHELQGIDYFKVTPTVELYTRQFYEEQFLTFIGDERFTKIHKEFLPAALEPLVNERDKSLIKDQMLWIRIDFPPNFSAEVLNEMSIAINCFPALNRKLNEIRYRLQSHFNIIPLITNDHFFDVNVVQNSEGQRYSPNPVEKKDLDKKGTFAVRNSGVQRFDSRNASELLAYLTEVLRDESNAFAAYGQDFISNLIKELNQNISQIEQKIIQNAVAIQARSTFIFVKPFEDNENIYVDFWTTNGELANQLRSGTKLTLYEGSDIDRESLYLMTTTFGGRERLSSTELLTAYKNALLSRGRIVTQKDILNLCQYIFGKSLKRLDVKKGVDIGSLPGQGLIRTMDLYLTVSEAAPEREELEGMKQELLVRLKMESMPFVNFRVFLQ